MQRTSLERPTFFQFAAWLALLPALACSAAEGTEWDDGGEAGDELGTLEQATQCGSTGDYRDVELYFGDLGVNPEMVQRTERPVAQTFTSNGTCTGTLIARNILLSAAHCDYEVGDEVWFNHQVGPGGVRTPVIHTVREILVEKYNINPFPEHTRGDYVLLRLNGTPAVTFGYQRLLNEEARTVTYQNQPLSIIGFPAIVPNAENFEVLAVGPFGDTAVTQAPNFFGARIDTLPGSSGATVLRADGQVVGLHTHSGCSPNTTFGNYNMRMPVLFNEIPLLRQLASMQGVQFANVDNLNGVDAIAVNFGRVSVRTSDGTRFTNQSDWTTNPYYGTDGTFFADVTGDRKADAIVINGGQFVVRRALTGGSFGPNEIWRDSAAPGFPVFANMNADLRADLIDVGPSGSVLFPATSANTFGAGQLWRAKKGTIATLVGDVSSDTIADIIAVNDDGVSVCVTENGNCQAKTWISGPWYGAYGTFLADVNGDGEGDIIAVNGSSTIVRRSTGTGFGPNETWLTGTHFGSLGMHFADADGDGKADFIAVNPEGVTVRKSNGTSFGAVQTWINVPYYGAL